MKEPAKDPYLVLIRTTSDEVSARHLLAEGETTVGRLRESDICLVDRTVSRAHCKLLRRGSEVRVVDVSGKNRTWIGDHPAGDRPLRHGDILRVGSCRLAFHGVRPQTSIAARRSAAHRQSPTTKIAGVTFVFVVGIVLTAWWSSREPDPSTSDDIRTDDASARATPSAPPMPPAIPPPRTIERRDAATRAGSEASRASLVSAVDDEAERRDIAPATSRIADAKIEPAASLEDDTTDVEPVAAKVAAPRAFTYYDTHIVPFLRKHCTSCHGKKRRKGKLSFEEWADGEASAADRKTWESVAQRLRKKEMPPSSKRQPEPAESGAIIAWIEAEVLKIDVDGKRDPGRVTMRRLNNYEYNYTIRDLTGLDLKLADDFPADDIGYGFDNIADVLSIPPLLMEKYLRAAAKVARAVMEDDEARSRVMICSPKKKAEVRSCAKKILREFGERAYRRPLKTSESTRLTKLVDLAIKSGDDFDKGIELGLQALLASPYFLFRVELDSRPNDPSAIRPVTDWELASRLSYFLWSSAPDDDLFDLARSRRLSNASVLEKQVERMLQDSRSRGLVKTFSALWLGSRSMKAVSPDPEIYPDFDESLRRAMRTETELFFQEIMRKDLSVLLFLDADFTFLNERLARHYGIGGVRGSEFRRVTLQPGRRGGVLTQGSVLTVTSNPTRTSPVKRGKWVLEQILGAPPPPPPPGADSFREEIAAAVNLTLRQKMAQHRRDPNCAVCHQKMDALGIALENYDGIGAWRERDGGVKIDPSGTLPGGRAFRNAEQLKKLLLEQKEDFCRCLTEKMLTFALGRGLEYADTPAVETIVGSLEKSGYRFSALVLGIVQSEPFRRRRGERMTP